MNVTIEWDEDGYGLIGPNGEEGEFTKYGQPATVEIDGKLYWALLPTEDEEYEEFGSLVYSLGEPVETEVVELEEDEDGDEPEE